MTVLPTLVGPTAAFPTLVGGDLPTLVGPLPTLVGLGQPDASDSGAGKIIYGGMLFALGISLGLAMGISHSVRITRGGGGSY